MHVHAHVHVHVHVHAHETVVSRLAGRARGFSTHGVRRVVRGLGLGRATRISVDLYIYTLSIAITVSGDSPRETM